MCIFLWLWVHRFSRESTQSYIHLVPGVSQREPLYLQSGWRSNMCRWRVALPSLKSVDMADTRTGYKEQLATTLPDLHKKEFKKRNQKVNMILKLWNDVAIQPLCTGLFHVYLVWYFKILSSPYLQSWVIQTQLKEEVSLYSKETTRHGWRPTRIETDKHIQKRT